MFYRNGSIIRQLILLRLLASGGGTVVTVTGVSPLALVNALAKPIRSLTQFGKCVQDGTPTPEAPVNIVCNNGTIRMVDDELPSGYTRLSYIESDGTSGASGSNGYVDTGILINSIDTNVEIDFQLTDTYAPSPRMAWGYMGTPSSLPRWGFGAYSSKWLGSPNGTASIGEVDTDRHVAVMRVYKDGSNSAFYDGTLDGETLYNTANLGNVSIFEDNDRWPVYLFARNNNNTAANFVPCKIFRFKVYKAGALTHDLVPCKDGNGVLGFYDLVTATFSVASGTLIAGAADYSHSHIGAVGTDEVLTVGGKNITSYILDMTVEGDGTSATLASDILTGDYVPKEARYTISIDVQSEDVTYSQSGTLVYFTVTYYGGSRDFIGVTTQNYMRSRISVTTAPGKTITSLALMKNARFTGGTIRVSNLQVEEGTTATDYEPYVSPQTVTDIPMLLSAGDITDEKDIISGGVTHKVGVKVFDGSEYNSWTVQSNRVYTSRSNIGMDDSDRPDSGVITCLSTHYADSSTNSVRINNSAMVLFYYDMASAGITTSAEWNAYLAAQYAAGTPVIVIYPLAEETTEQTTPHSLHTSAGTNIVDVESNVDPVELEVEYVASVA